MTKETKLYEVQIFVDGMMEPEVATLEIEAMTGKEAMKWVKDNLRLSALEI